MLYKICDQFQFLNWLNWFALSKFFIRNILIFDRWLYIKRRVGRCVYSEVENNRMSKIDLSYLKAIAAPYIWRYFIVWPATVTWGMTDCYFPIILGLVENTPMEGMGWESERNRRKGDIFYRLYSTRVCTIYQDLITSIYIYILAKHALTPQYI